VDKELLARAQTALAQSELLRAVASVGLDGGRTFALGDRPLRPLSGREVDCLQRQGNSAEEWSRVLVSEDFDLQRVRNCQFIGSVVLGRFAARIRLAGSVELPAGVWNSTIVDSVLGDDVLVRNVALLANYVIRPRALVVDCGQVVCEGETTFGNGTEVAVGVETGGRRLPVHAELDVELASAAAGSVGRGSTREGYLEVARQYAARARSRRGIIDAEARVLSTPQVKNVYVGTHAQVNGATLVADSTLLSSEREPTCVSSGACVRSSLLQWGSTVSTMALVERSLLTEHSHAERQGKVTDSILGPNSAVGAGEVTSSLLGPFVTCHHQSLLIATLWPAGKGNVGYGANVGSNHTSRAPDQEFRAGEGMFFGLGVNVKFPSDFSRAPYTVVACGATLLPQKMTFPFSLISTPSRQLSGVSPALMEIFPGWMLGENLYALRRNEAKYRARNRACRGAFELAFLRADTVDLMRAARRRLEEAGPRKEVYTEAEIEGLGKNFLFEASRRSAVEAYRLFIRYYALLGLKERVRMSLDGPGEDPSRLLAIPSQEEGWEHQRQILAEEGIGDVESGLCELSRLLEQLGDAVESARLRDDRRGSRIMDDYADVHVPAALDELVREHWQEVRRLQAEAERLRLRWQEFAGCRAPLAVERPLVLSPPEGERAGSSLLVDSGSGM
jgi:hypothetical protein